MVPYLYSFLRVIIVALMVSYIVHESIQCPMLVCIGLSLQKICRHTYAFIYIYIPM